MALARQDKLASKMSGKYPAVLGESGIHRETVVLCRHGRSVVLSARYAIDFSNGLTSRIAAGMRA